MNETQDKMINDYLEKEKQNRNEQSSFVKTLVFMIIIFAGVLLGIFLFADNLEKILL